MAKCTVNTKISAHSYNLFKLFMDANFGSLVEVGYYSESKGFITTNYMMYTYDDSNLDFDFIRMKFAFNGHSNIEQSFLDYEHGIRRSVY